MNHRFDDQLPERLTDLVGPATAADGRILAAIRTKAAVQRQRHLAGGLAMAVVTLAAGIGGTVAISGADNSRPNPAVVPAVGYNKLLNWPTRGEKVSTTLTDRATAAWSSATGTSPITLARPLYVGTSNNLQTIVVAEGLTAAGQARLAVLVSETQKTYNDQDEIHFRLTMDVPSPTIQPRTLLIAIAGLIDAESASDQPSRNHGGIVVGLTAPTSQPSQLVAEVDSTPDTDGPIREDLQPAVGYATIAFNAPPGTTNQEILAGYSNTEFIGLAYPSDSGSPPAAASIQQIEPDDDRFAKPLDGSPRSAILVPRETPTRPSTTR